ncbi:MAG: hypothetical protein KKB51_05315 [Candidatus Riflebacteria bacterium]|nr:hypothetical protein [Candidatus Riflebacteria bacterium]
MIERRGSVLLLAVFIAISLTILSLSYFRMMRAVKTTDQRLESQFVAREIALMLREEAMAVMLRDSRDRRSQFFWFLLGAVSGAQTEMRLPLASEKISSLIQSGYTCEFTSRLKVVNFINYDHKNRNYASPKEGHGILAILIEVNLVDERQGRKSVIAKEYLQTQYDYLIASVLCLDNQGSKLCQPLMLRRDGQVLDENSRLQISDFGSRTSNDKLSELELYSRSTLWVGRNLRASALERLRVIDEEQKIIRLNGIMHCAEKLTFDGDWKIDGKGVIVADSFSINGALTKKTDNDFLVLYARKGNIVLNTSEKIEAALVAINPSYSGTIESKQSLNLYGMLLADYLNLDAWSNTPHKISFDEVCRDSEKSFQISISPWANFRSGARN